MPRAKRLLALVCDLLLLVALAIALLVTLTGGGVFDVGGQTVSVTRTGNPLGAFALLALVRYVWLGQVPFLRAASAPRETLDRYADSLLRSIRAGGTPAGCSFLVALVAVTCVLRVINAWSHPGFVTGDDVELHELTFKRLFAGEWPIWELRSPLYPMVFLYPVQALALRLEYSDPAALVFAARLAVIVVATLAPLLVFAIAIRLTGNRAIAVLACGLFATSRLHLWFGSSELPRPIAAVFALASFYVLIAGRERWRAVVAGASLGVAGSLRFGELVFVAPAIGHLALERRLRDAATAAVAGIGSAAMLLGVADWLYWGVPFFSLRAIVGYTIVEGQSSRGFQPPWFYLSNVTEWSNPVVAALSLYSLTGREPRPAIWGWTAIALLSLLPHKEARYVIAAQPFVCISAALAIPLVAERCRVGARTVILLLLAVATLFEATSWRVRRTDVEVRLAREIVRLQPDSIAASEMWRFGGRLYWKDVPEVVTLPDMPLDSAPDVDVIVLVARDTDQRALEVLTGAGFQLTPLGEGTDYLVLAR
jgi:hypothetical protein